MDLTKASLLPRHVEAGMTLTEDDHVITLFVKGKPIATWTWSCVTTFEIRAVADEALRQTAISE